MNSPMHAKKAALSRGFFTNTMLQTLRADRFAGTASFAPALPAPVLVAAAVDTV
jgi:hypothetical protein